MLNLFLSGMSYALSLALGIVCLAISVIDLEALPSSQKAPTKYVSECRKNSYTAFKLCLDKLATSKAEKRECAQLFTKLFPSCYFKNLKKDNVMGVLDAYSKCVMESASYGETFACENAKNEILTASDASSSDEVSYLQKRNIQECNTCRNYYDMCHMIADSWEKADICGNSLHTCFGLHKCI